MMLLPPSLPLFILKVIFLCQVSYSVGEKKGGKG